jgi:serine/threonine-protein kinase RsbW
MTSQWSSLIVNQCRGIMDRMPPSFDLSQASAWRTLADFSLVSEPGNEKIAMHLVEEAVRQLNLPPDRLERLKTAVAEATMNATEHGNGFRSDLPVTIQVMASENIMSVQITDYGENGPIEFGEKPEIEAKLNGHQSMRGWGFFLIEKMVDEVQIKNGDANHTIQLFLYLEGS